MSFDRRTFLRLLGTGAVANASLKESIAKALAIPANNATRSIADVEHVVILMQENRSFDHYFGTLRGVRGFADPRAVTLRTGNSVFHQPDAGGGYVLPFRPQAADLGMQFLDGLAHDWTTGHEAWNAGNYDRWVPAKTALTMAHLERNDIPFHYALADAFTICDAYHCSLIGPTNPNRCHLFTGWVGNDGAGGGPAIDNAQTGFTWSTFPETLESAGISWKVYQDIGRGLNAAGQYGETSDPYIGNYGDNPLLHFDAYRNALPGSALYDKAVTGTHAAAGESLFEQFRHDVAGNALPKVSWVIAPEAYSEHPNWPPNYGAYYVSQILDALTSSPAVWSRTALFLMYDENDGFFDHVVPPTPPSGAAQGRSNISVDSEIYPGSEQFPRGPYGLGPRVPMLVISPWSKGGWVCSEVFDHTSLIRFVAARFGSAKTPLAEPNISAWRSAVAGDLTSAFNFESPTEQTFVLPSTGGYAPADDKRHESFVPRPPALQALPAQEPGTRPARAVPYTLHANAAADPATGEVSVEFINSGRRAAVLHVRSSSAQLPPRTYTIAPATSLSDVWNHRAVGLETYALSVHGPNGFLRAFFGGLGVAAVNIQTSLQYEIARGGITLTAVNRGTSACELAIRNRYGAEAAPPARKRLEAGAALQRYHSLTQEFGWYDILLTAAEDAAFRQQLAGHLETGKDSITDPAIGAR